MPYYDVLIEHSALSLNQTFSYFSDKEIACGVRVKVPFGRQTLVGLVMARHEEKPQGDFIIKKIISTLDPQPLLNEELQALSRYLSERTLSSLMSVIQTMLPSAYKPTSKAAKVVYEDWIIPQWTAKIEEQISLNDKNNDKIQENAEEIPEELSERSPDQQESPGCKPEKMEDEDSELENSGPAEESPARQNEEAKEDSKRTKGFQRAQGNEPSPSKEQDPASYEPVEPKDWLKLLQSNQAQQDLQDENDEAKTGQKEAETNLPEKREEGSDEQLLQSIDPQAQELLIKLKEKAKFSLGTNLQHKRADLKDFAGIIEDPKPIGLDEQTQDETSKPSSSCLLQPEQPEKKEAADREVFAEELAALKTYGKLTNKQKETALGIQQPVKASIARKQFSPAVIKALITKGLLSLEQRPKSFLLTQMKARESWPELTRSQKQALRQIRQSENPMILLHGVTGSGKTEVFFHLMQEQLNQGKQVLLLVPEIGLTPMMIARIQNRFACPLVIFHSRLSSAEAADQYRRVKEMGSGIILGTRSAVFLPADNLGVIIMDEEHDTSYKQDSMPKYHVRDAAEFRAKWHGCKLIMASATPCLESYARAIKNVYTLVKMTTRAAGSLPDIHLIDMRRQRSFGGLSYPLIQQIQKRLDAKEQVILLLNRRGYIPVARCTACKGTVECEDCGIPLSYHKHEKALVCHICGRHYPLQKECPHCHKASWSDLGLGTQKLEESLQELFPQARVVRMDADSTRSKHGHAEVLDAFEKEGDILLGTQMVAKGLDYERVTLTGIINADNALARADYRAAEMSYQMLEQASGRSGRGRKKGEVLIQTYNPDHYVLQDILHHDYRSFFVREMQYRHLGWYPPYLFMASLVFLQEDLNQAYAAATSARMFFEAKGVWVFGPMELTMRKKVSRVRLLIKEKDHERLSSLLWEYTEWHKTQLKKIEYEINIDPMVLEE